MTEQSRQSRAHRESAPLRCCAGPGTSGGLSLLQRPLLRRNTATCIWCPGGKDEECSGHSVICGTVGNAGIVCPRVGSFKVALIYHGPTFIEHHHAPAVGFTRTPPSDHSLADKGCEENLTLHIPVVRVPCHSKHSRTQFCP